MISDKVIPEEWMMEIEKKKGKEKRNVDDKKYKVYKLKYKQNKYLYGF